EVPNIGGQSVADVDHRGRTNMTLQRETFADARREVEMFAEDTAAGVAAMTQNGISYVSGGIGAAQQQALKSMRKDYNLLLTFAVKKSGAYLADIKVNIQNAKGDKVLDTVSSGPLFYAKLAPGKYRVMAESKDKVLTKSVSIGKRGAKDLYFYWDAKYE
ncbi:MAG: hypothetical protein ABI476_03830, partial [Oxalobacteraceae bacterium]